MMKIEELMKDMDRVHGGIQHLQIQPTKSNTAIILDALTVLENAYAVLDEIQAREKQEEVNDNV